jgi:hypothetical protein
MPRQSFIPFMMCVLLLLTACSNMGNLYIGQDTPDDLNPLLENNEYSRARLLTGKYPSIDTPQIQEEIIHLENNYVAATVSDAKALESENDLLNAVQLLSGALQKVPHSTQLRDLRNTLEKERTRQLRNNDRKQLITRAHYLIDQQQLYHQQVNLESPSIGQRWNHSRNKKEVIAIAKRLYEHGHFAVRQENIDIALECLQLSQELHESSETRKLLTGLESMKNSQIEVAEQEAGQKKAKKKKKQAKKQRQVTAVLLAETRQALDEDDVQVARATFSKIPSSTSKNSTVTAIQDDLEQAVDKHVTKLITRGDAQYRADNVNGAIKLWTEARQLDPENQELKERLDRARKVLARLEELKSQQHK